MEINRRQFVIQSSAYTGALLAAAACAPRNRGDYAGTLSSADMSPPKKPLQDAQGNWIRYKIRAPLDPHVENLLKVYGHVMSIMMSAVPQSQVTACGGQVTPGQFTKYLPELVQQNAWEPFSWWCQAEIHFMHCAHGNENFLFWHRPYLFYFEKAVRKIACRIVELDGAAALRAHPDYYTQWTLPVFHWDPKSPVAPTFFDSSIFPALIDNSNIGTGAARQIDRNSVPDADQAPWANFIDVRPETIEHILQTKEIISLTGSQSLGGMLEGAPHGGIHVWVGGQMGAFFSPLDPIFWTHHAMIDFILEEWMTRRRNEGYSDAEFLPEVLRGGKQAGFFDIDTGKPASWDNSFLIVRNNHKVTYDGLTQAGAAPKSLGLELADSNAGMGFGNHQQVYIDEFNSEYSEFLDPGQNGSAPTQVLRTKLKAAEGKATTKDAIALLEKIRADLISGNRSMINSVQLRFENLTAAVENPYNSTLQIRVRKGNLPPFIKSNFAVFPRFGARATQDGIRKQESERAKYPNSHGGHDTSRRGLMIDLLPIIAKMGNSLDFKELLTSDTFTVDFRVATAGRGRQAVSSPLTSAAKAAMQKDVKITLMITHRPRRS